MWGKEAGNFYCYIFGRRERERERKKRKKEKKKERKKERKKEEDNKLKKKSRL